jgi:hypothetical protein
LNDGNVETRGLESRARTVIDVVKGAVHSGERAFPGASGSQGENGIGNTVEGAVEDTADGSRVVDDAVGLAALNDCDAVKRPAIDALPASVSVAKTFGEVTP